MSARMLTFLVLILWEANSPQRSSSGHSSREARLISVETIHWRPRGSPPAAAQWLPRSNTSRRPWGGCASHALATQVPRPLHRVVIRVVDFHDSGRSIEINPSIFHGKSAAIELVRLTNGSPIRSSHENSCICCCACASARAMKAHACLYVWIHVHICRICACGHWLRQCSKPTRQNLINDF